jgi:hypothetical protein
MLDRLHEREQQKKRMKLDGTRRFRRAYIEQGKGNGKSPLAGGIGTITRRNALLRTAALASVGMIPAAPVPGIAARLASRPVARKSTEHCSCAPRQ